MPMFDVYNCFYKPSNLISYIICISLFAHDSDLEKLIQLIYDIRHNKIDYLSDNDLRIFLFNDNTIGEVFKFLSIVYQNNITDMSIRNLSNLPVEIDYSDPKEKEMVTNFILLLVDLNIKHIPDNIQLSLSKIKTKTLTKSKPVFVGSLDLHINNNYQTIFTIYCDYINCLYFKLFILINGEHNYLNIGKNSNNTSYLYTNNKSENIWYFIKKNNSIRTSNFNKTKIIPVDFDQNQDGYLIISKDNKYILKIKKPEDIFNSYEEWNKFKISNNFLVSNMIVTLIDNKEYILDIVSRDEIISNEPSNYLYLSKHEDSIKEDNYNEV